MQMQWQLQVFSFHLFGHGLFLKQRQACQLGYQFLWSVDMLSFGLAFGKVVHIILTAMEICQLKFSYIACSYGLSFWSFTLYFICWDLVTNIFCLCFVTPYVDQFYSLFVYQPRFCSSMYGGCALCFCFGQLCVGILVDCIASEDYMKVFIMSYWGIYSTFRSTWSCHKIIMELMEYASTHFLYIHVQFTKSKGCF